MARIEYQEKTMHKKSFILFLVIGALALVACDMDSPGEPPSLYGPKVAGQNLYTPGYCWDSRLGAIADSFYINLESGIYRFYYYSAPGTLGYSGKIVGDAAADPTLLSSKYGYLTIQIEANSSMYHYPIGNYIVIHWKDLGSNQVRQSVMYRTGSSKNWGLPTREAAEAEYTEDNGYFGIHALCYLEPRVP
jgi:hypothetical protein